MSDLRKKIIDTTARLVSFARDDFPLHELERKVFLRVIEQIDNNFVNMTTDIMRYVERAIDEIVRSGMDKIFIVHNGVTPATRYVKDILGKFSLSWTSSREDAMLFNREEAGAVLALAERQFSCPCFVRIDRHE